MESRYLRTVLEQDMDLLYEWVNEKSVRNHSFSTDYISYENHRKWFMDILEREDVMQYIYMQGSKPIGQVRIHVAGQEAEIDYSIDIKYRNQGHGKYMIRLLQEQIKYDFPRIRKLTAKVKPNNLASHKIFQDIGYTNLYSFYAVEISETKI